MELQSDPGPQSLDGGPLANWDGEPSVDRTPNLELRPTNMNMTLVLKLGIKEQQKVDLNFIGLNIFISK